MDPIQPVKNIFTDREVQSIQSILDTGLLREGTYTKQFEEEFQRLTNSAHSVACSSGTAALHLVYQALLNPGDEVIVPAFTFIATASVLAHVGAIPVFADIDSKTWNLDAEQVESLISPKTKAIVGVHLFGNACNVKRLQEIAKKHDCYLIWDAAQALGAKYGDQDVAEFADAACFSFYPSKNLTTGEGGMVSCQDENLATKIRVLKNHGETEKYKHAYLGFNYRITEISAAIGLAQLASLSEGLKRRFDIAEKYQKAFQKSDKFVVQAQETNSQHAYNYFCIALRDGAQVGERDDVIQKLRQKDIPTAIYYPIPLHKQPCFENLYRQALPVSESLCERILSLPIHPHMSDDQVDYISKVLLEEI